MTIEKVQNAAKRREWENGVVVLSALTCLISMIGTLHCLDNYGCTRLTGAWLTAFTISLTIMLRLVVKHSKAATIVRFEVLSDDKGRGNDVNVRVTVDGAPPGAAVKILVDGEEVPAAETQ